MKSDRSQESRQHSRYKQARKRLRADKRNLHRVYLRHRLELLKFVLDDFREGHQMPTGWLGLYPELSSILPQIDQVDNLLWLLNEELGRWFYLLRGPSCAAKGIAPKVPPASIPEDRFTLDLVSMCWNPRCL